jgi:hypothetical protein
MHLRRLGLAYGHCLPPSSRLQLRRGSPLSITAEAMNRGIPCMGTSVRAAG